MLTVYGKLQKTDISVVAFNKRGIYNSRDGFTAFRQTASEPATEMRLARPLASLMLMGLASVNPDSYLCKETRRLTKLGSSFEVIC